VKRHRVVVLTSLAFSAGLAIGGLRADATPEAQNPYQVVNQLGRVLVQVENHYVDPVERNKLVEGAIKGMVENLDPHSSYLPPDEWKEFQSDTEGKFGGVGLEVDGRGDKLIVIAPIEGSPAQRAGIKSGDQIVGVDGEDVIGQPLDKVVKRMRGAAGTKVKITMLREAKGGVLTAILLDVRSNPGGLVDEATEIADEFLTSGGIYSMRHRGEVIEDLKARSGGAFADIPCVALVNEWSASASELLVGALQDNKRATVVGANTFGKGSVQSILPLPNGAGLKLTTARYYTPSGHAIQADGIHPDVRIESGPSGAQEVTKVTRERDLPGHLPPEGPQGGNTARDAGGVVLDGGARDEVSAVARDIPVDPSSSRDAVLRVGYQMLKAQITTRATGAK
jgi:carboxyl-terminal processing protease